MFTGLIQHVGTVAALNSAEHGVTIDIDIAGWSHRPGQGDSIAVNGCCLTARVDELSHDILRFDVIHETLRRTTIGRLAVGQSVNLEHAATPQTLLGGHLVQGHIDGIGDVASIDRNDGEYLVRIATPKSLRMFFAPKGSVAVDGVSLTIAEVHDDGFSVALIPTTLQLTTLSELAVGGAVNIEVDYIAKLVVQTTQRLQQST